MEVTKDKAIKLKERFKADAIDYHFKVSRLIGHIKENGFILVPWLPQLKECRDILEELILEKLDYYELTQQFADNHDLPYHVIDKAERPEQFSQGATDAATKLHNSGKELAKVISEETISLLNDFLRKLSKRINRSARSEFLNLL